MFKYIKEKTKDSKRIYRVLIIALLVIVFLYSGVTLVNQSTDISRMQKQKQELSAQLVAKKQDNEQLQEVVDSSNKDGYIEQKAREKGYAKGNEIVFYDISGTE